MTQTQQGDRGGRGAGRRQAGKGFSWGFRNAFGTILVLAVWAEVLAGLVARMQAAEGPSRWFWAAGFFLAVLPFPAAVIYFGRVVFGFFRSIKVGVINLVFLGLGSMAGVLFHQEDPNAPIPPVEEGMTVFETGRYNHYLDFRHAHAYFTFHLLHGPLGGKVYHLLPGTPATCAVDEKEIASKIQVLEKRLPEIRSRLGEDFAVGLKASSEAGLRTRGENREIQALETSWDDFWWTLFTWADRLDFLRVYKSPWFACFWVILFGGVLSNTFRGGWRRLLRPGKWGFAATHAGVMLVILGAALGRFREERGILELHVGERSDHYMGYDRIQRPFLNRVPFQVKLDAFRADLHDVLQVVFVKKKPDGQLDYEFALDRQPKFRIYPGLKLAFDRDEEGRPALQLEILEYERQAVMGLRIRPAEAEEDGIPLARVVLEADSGGPRAPVVLLPLREETPGQNRILVDGPGGLRVAYLPVQDEAGARAALEHPVPRRYAVLRPRLAGGGTSLPPIEVVPGGVSRLESGQDSYQVEILDAMAHLRLQRNPEGKLEPAAIDPIEHQEPTIPAVHLRITNSQGASEERWILQEEFHQDPSRVFPGLKFEMDWDAWAYPALGRWLLMQLPDGHLLLGELGRPDSLHTLASGGRAPLAPGIRLHLLEAYPRAVPEPTFHAVPGSDFYNPAPAAIRLKVVEARPGDPAVPRERTLVLSTREGIGQQLLRYTGPDGEGREVVLQFQEDQQDLPVEWRSRLSFFEQQPGTGRWEPVQSGEIRVNDYLVHSGFRFFQTNARPEDPTYSGIGVVYDPGMMAVLFGLYLVALGTFVVFLVKPLVTRRYRGL
ncbi:MAG: hypothetical protein ACE5H3_06665 [Planctomycetota bacterium]